MTDSDALEARIEVAVRRLTAPLEAELQALRAEVAALRGEGAPSQPPAPVVIAPAPAPVVPAAAFPLLPDLPVAAAVPPERNDFARMLARGLEAEARSSEAEPGQDEAENVSRKRGWNPFKR